MRSPKSDLLFAKDSDGAAILDSSRGTITTLNATGTFVWQGLQRGDSSEQIIADLVNASGVPELTVRQDVQAFLDAPEIQNLLKG